MSWTAQKINKTIIKKKTRWGWGGVEILGVKKSKVREMSWTAQKINKQIFKKKTGGGWGVEVLGVKKSKVREISWTAQKINNFFFFFLKTRWGVGWKF